MKKLLNYLPFHFLIGLIIGIIIQFNYKLWQFGFAKLLVVFIILFIVIFVLHLYIKKQLFTFLSFVFFVFIGISSVYIQNDKNYKKYFEYFLNEETTSVLNITKVLKTGNYNDKYIAEVIQINKQKTIGKILLNVNKKGAKAPLKVGTQVFLKPTFKAVNPPLNPHQFNYAEYLKKQGIYKQIHTNQNEFKIIGNSNFSLVTFASTVRETIQKSLKNHHFSDNEFAVINALFLGQRQEISTELKESYTNAGVIHILAISGLHIGILMLLLSYILKPLESIKHGTLIKSVLIVILLWIFALITGLSASVVRAVTMFTFVTIGQSLQKKQVVEYSLITSMLLLLLIQPLFLFDIGFQLSYLAVFGIIWIQPLLVKRWKPKYKITYKIWQLITVSLSAQIGILPISLYYFNQFPSLFLLSNLVIIPTLGSILAIGILIIILSLLNILPQFLADFYGFIISLLNRFVEWIAQQEQFLFKEISVSFLLLLGLYLFIFGFFQLFKQAKLKQLYFFLSTILLVQSIIIYEKYQKNTKQEFIVFHKGRHSVFGKRKGKTAKIYSDIKIAKLEKQKFLNSYKIREEISLKTMNKVPNTFRFKNETILIIDSLGVYNIPQLKNPIVILTQSPKINIHRVILTLQPNLIIADGSNYKSYVNLWKQSCENKKTPFYYTQQNGAYVIN